MFNNITKLLIIQLTLGLLWSAPASAAPVIEVVESAPIETDLMVPGIRDTAEVWVDMIGRAKKTIELEQFYVFGKEGQALDPILSALRAAAGRGVKIRLLIDSKFYPNYPTNADELSKVPNIQVRTIDFSAHGGIQHAKYFVIDSKEAFVGSCNFDWVALTHVHEVGLRIEDNAVTSSLHAIFERDWSNGKPLQQSTTDEKVDKKKAADAERLRLVCHPNLEVVGSPYKLLPKGILFSLIPISRLIETASTSVRIQLYEYATKNYANDDHWYLLDDDLRRAASRGVHVQLLVDKTSLKDGKSDLEKLAKLPNVEVKVVTIPSWSGGEIPFARLAHSKYMIVDDEHLWLGSENWRGDYFLNSRNVGVVLYDNPASEKVNAIFERLWNSAYASALSDPEAKDTSPESDRSDGPKDKNLFLVEPEVVNESRYSEPGPTRPTEEARIRELLEHGVGSDTK